MRRPLTGEGEVGSARLATGTGSLWLDCDAAPDRDRFERAVGGGTGVAFGERAMLVAETVEVVVNVVEEGDDDGFTVVHPLRLLALDIARGFATLSEERVDVDREIEYRVRAEASEGTGMDSAGQQQGSIGVSWRVSGRCHEQQRTLECATFPHSISVSNTLYGLLASNSVAEPT